MLGIKATQNFITKNRLIIYVYGYNFIFQRLGKSPMKSSGGGKKGGGGSSGGGPGSGGGGGRNTESSEVTESEEEDIVPVKGIIYIS